MGPGRLASGTSPQVILSVSAKSAHQKVLNQAQNDGVWKYLGELTTLPVKGGAYIWRGPADLNPR